jgi:hypothetical protein
MAKKQRTFIGAFERVRIDFGSFLVAFANPPCYSVET